MTKPIRQPVLNSMKRVGIDPTMYDNEREDVEVCNRFGGGCCTTTELLSFLVGWVYDVSNQYEMGDTHIALADFDRIKYFVLEQDSTVYATCID